MFIFLFLVRPPLLSYFSHSQSFAFSYTIIKPFYSSIALRRPVAHEISRYLHFLCIQPKTVLAFNRATKAKTRPDLLIPHSFMPSTGIDPHAPFPCRTRPVICIRS